MPLVSLTRATLRSAELGFFGVVVYTRVHTPRRCGLPVSAALLVFATLSWRPFRTSCWMVGMDRLSVSVRVFTGTRPSSARSSFCAPGVEHLSGTVFRTPPRPEVGRVAHSPDLRRRGVPIGKDPSGLAGGVPHAARGCRDRHTRNLARGRVMHGHADRPAGVGSDK